VTRGRSHLRSANGLRPSGFRGRLKVIGPCRNEVFDPKTIIGWIASDAGMLDRSVRHPYTIQIDGKRMALVMTDNVQELRPRPADTEKITINLGYVDLGHVDLMVQEGFYSNRTDFIRTAIRNQLERHADVVKQSTARKSLDLGLRNYSREDLEAARRAGEILHIKVLGLASIAQDVTPELARATIASISVLGALHASPAVKAALADRMR
jgi:Arc/MetJ-type ribon-helix-helix transcriptional regulator